LTVCIYFSLQQPLPGLDGPITALVKVQVLGLNQLIVNILMDFTTQSLSRSGWIVSALFFVVVLGFIGLLLFIVFINLDIPENRGPFYNLSFAAYCLGLIYLFFKLLHDALLVRVGFMP
jgi:hypothetical protein